MQTLSESTYDCQLFVLYILPTFIVSYRSSFMCVCVRELGHKMYMETIRLVNSYREIS